MLSLIYWALMNEVNEVINLMKYGCVWCLSVANLSHNSANPPEEEKEEGQSQAPEV